MYTSELNIIIVENEFEKVLFVVQISLAQIDQCLSLDLRKDFFGNNFSFSTEERCTLIMNMVTVHFTRVSTVIFFGNTWKNIVFFFCYKQIIAARYFRRRPHVYSMKANICMLFIVLLPSICCAGSIILV